MGIPISKLFTNVKQFTKSNLSSLMIGGGIVAIGSSVVLAVKATPLALDCLDSKAEQEMCEPCDLTAKERISACWKVYTPAATAFIMGTGMIVGGHIVQLRKTAAIASAAALTEQVFREYRAVAMEQLGDAGNQAVRDKLAERRLAKENITTTHVTTDTPFEITVTAHCMEPLSGRIFTSSRTEIERAINNANAALLEDGYLSLNDLNDELGLEHIPPGDEIGWNYYRDHLIDVHFTARINSDGLPLLVMDYNSYPTSGFMH